ncbi:ATP-dependent DNA helicase yku80 [Sporothrix epigloea]|uniref:ATP-dependent DNA helicase II subunit 2 n=1 Tax=Sporothrix epigloea TaxID=1892477 RepID=A0ABP0D957_9PEZI
MADKEVTVYIVDLGATMGETHGGRDESGLDWAMRYVWDKISTTVASSRKTWKVGVVGLRTDTTSNPLQEDEGYDNITVLQKVDVMSLTAMRALGPRIRPSKTVDGDAVSAIIVAVEMVSVAAPARLKFNRKIVLVTDGRGAIDGDDLDDLALRINELGINLVVIGVDFDDIEYGFKEENKPKLKADNERLLSTLVEKCNDGVLGTLAEAVDEVQKPTVKATRPFRSYDGPLTLGDPETFDGALSINIERFFLTKVSSPPSATSVVIRSEAAHAMGETDDVDMGNVDFTAIRNERVYTVDDPTRLGGKREVEFAELDKGYEYGRTAVYISASDANVTQLQTQKSFSILGFISRANAQPYLHMGESCIITPRRFSEEDELAFSALVHAMVETDTCAVARLVIKDMKDPVMLLLLPTVTASHVCLYDVPLPFAEDVRSYPFPPLDKVITASGAVLTKHRLLPNDDLNKAMSDYVDAMDFSMLDTDSDGQSAGFVDLEENYSPIIYRINQAISFRATHPDKPYVREDSKYTLMSSHPPEELVDSARSQIAALIRAADVKKVPPRAKGRARRDADKNKPISGLDVDALLSGGGSSSGRGPIIKKESDEPSRISPDNAIPEYKQALARTVSVAQIESLTQQMGQITESLIASSTGEVNYPRATENLRVMREELVSLQEPSIYNTFITGLKERLVAEKLGGPRLDMWWAIRLSGLGLITSNESEQSTVSEDAAKEFLRPKAV